MDTLTILAILWFLLGFGAGYVAIKLWKVLLVVIVVALLAPIILGMLGLAGAPPAESVLAAFINGLYLLAAVIGSNQFSVIGFVLGVIVGLVVSLARGRF
ncbi:MAG: hypothetical protein QXO30_03645 [Candidatus Caldarchaeum sp.]